jgi:hypothetical protein
MEVLPLRVRLPVTFHTLSLKPEAEGILIKTLNSAGPSPIIVFNNLSCFAIV